MRRRAVRCEAHHLVFIAILEKAEILGDGEVQQTKRMRKIYVVENLQRVSSTNGPRGANKIAESVNGTDRGLVKRGNKERAREVSRVVFYPVHLANKLAPCQSERFTECRRQVLHPTGIMYTIAQKSRSRSPTQSEQNFPPEMG